MNVAILILGIFFLILGILGLWAYYKPPRDINTLIGGVIFTSVSLLCFILFVIGA